MPIEREVPTPMFLFGKDISIQDSLDKWEQNLTTNTLTNYDEQVSKQALKNQEKSLTDKRLLPKTPTA